MNFYLFIYGKLAHRAAMAAAFSAPRFRAELAKRAVWAFMLFAGVHILMIVKNTNDEVKKKNYSQAGARLPAGSLFLRLGTISGIYMRTKSMIQRGSVWL